MKKRNEGMFQDKKLSIKVRDLVGQDGQLHAQEGKMKLN